MSDSGDLRRRVNGSRRGAVLRSLFLLPLLIAFWIRTGLLGGLIASLIVVLLIAGVLPAVTHRSYKKRQANQAPGTLLIASASLRPSESHPLVTGGNFADTDGRLVTGTLTIRRDALDWEPAQRGRGRQMSAISINWVDVTEATVVALGGLIHGAALSVALQSGQRATVYLTGPTADELKSILASAGVRVS